MVRNPAVVDALNTIGEPYLTPKKRFEVLRILVDALDDGENFCPAGRRFGRFEADLVCLTCPRRFVCINLGDT